MKNTHRAIEAVWRIESAKLIAGLARAEFQRAASLTQNLRERKLLLERAAAVSWGTVKAHKR